jgi:hypothetical protein
MFPRVLRVEPEEDRTSALAQIHEEEYRPFSNPDVSDDAEDSMVRAGPVSQ